MSLVDRKPQASQRNVNDRAKMRKTNVREMDAQDTVEPVSRAVRHPFQSKPKYPAKQVNKR